MNELYLNEQTNDFDVKSLSTKNLNKISNININFIQSWIWNALAVLQVEKTTLKSIESVACWVRLDAVHRQQFS